MLAPHSARCRESRERGRRRARSVDPNGFLYLIIRAAPRESLIKGSSILLILGGETLVQCSRTCCADGVHTLPNSEPSPSPRGAQRGARGAERLLPGRGRGAQKGCSPGGGAGRRKVAPRAGARGAERLLPGRGRGARRKRPGRPRLLCAGAPAPLRPCAPADDGFTHVHKVSYTDSWL